MDLGNALNEVLVKLFHNVNDIEEQMIRTGEYKDVTVNDMHVIEAIGIGQKKNMTTVAKELYVTMGTLTISINSLVKKDYVERERSGEDRRVVLVSLTPRGQKAFIHHQRFHERMIDAIVEQLSEEEQRILEKSLRRINQFFLSSRKDWGEEP